MENHEAKTTVVVGSLGHLRLGDIFEALHPSLFDWGPLAEELCEALLLHILRNSTNKDLPNLCEKSLGNVSPRITLESSQLASVVSAPPWTSRGWGEARTRSAIGTWSRPSTGADGAQWAILFRVDDITSSCVLPVLIEHAMGLLVSAME